MSEVFCPRCKTIIKPDGSCGDDCELGSGSMKDYSAPTHHTPDSLDKTIDFVRKQESTSKPTESGKYKLTLEVDVEREESSGYLLFQFPLNEDWLDIDDVKGQWSGPKEPSCDHEWIDARNEVITSGEVCLKCRDVRPSP